MGDADVNDDNPFRTFFSSTTNTHTQKERSKYNPCQKALGPYTIRHNTENIRTQKNKQTRLWHRTLKMKTYNYLLDRGCKMCMV